MIPFLSYDDDDGGGGGGGQASVNLPSEDLSQSFYLFLLFSFSVFSLSRR
jgi:hypothetical protein